MIWCSEAWSTQCAVFVDYNATLIWSDQCESETWPYGHECWCHDTTPKESAKPVRLAEQAKKTLGTLFETMQQSPVWKKTTSNYCDKFERIHKNNHVDTRVSQEKRKNLNKTDESSDWNDQRNKVSAKSVAVSDINVVLCSSTLKSFNSLIFDRVSWLCRRINQSPSGPWWVATRCSPPRIHPTSSRSNRVSVNRCCAHCQQMLQLLSLSIHFPLLSSFSIVGHFDPCVVVLYFIAFFVSPVSSGLRKKSFNAPSHIFFGLPTGLFVRCLVQRQKFHSVPFFSHRSSGSDAILIAKRHVILVCVSIQHGMQAAFILSIAIAMLLFMYSFHSSSSISPASISSSESFMKEMSMSWSQSVFELLPSAFSSDENVAFTFSSS